MTSWQGRYTSWRNKVTKLFGELKRGTKLRSVTFCKRSVRHDFHLSLQNTLTHRHHAHTHIDTHTYTTCDCSLSQAPMISFKASNEFFLLLVVVGFFRTKVNRTMHDLNSFKQLFDKTVTRDDKSSKEMACSRSLLSSCHLASTISFTLHQGGSEAK